MYNLSSIVLADKTSYGVVDFSQNINNPYETKCAPNKFGKYIGIENVTYDDLKNKYFDERWSKRKGFFYFHYKITIRAKSQK